MKKRSFVLAVLVLFVPALLCMDRGLPKCDTAQTVVDAVYFKAIPVIDFLVKAKLKAFSCFHRLKKTESVDVDQIIQKKLECIELELRQQECRTMEDIAKKNGINKKSLAECLAIIEEQKKFSEGFLGYSREDVIHHSEFPEEVYTLLTYNRIHHDSVDLIVSNNSLAGHADTQACASAPFSLSLSIGDKDFSFASGLLEGKAFAPGIITVYPPFFEGSFVTRLAALIHEVEHINQKHIIKNGVFSLYLQLHNPRLNQMNIELVFDSDEMNALRIVFEREAEIFPALRTPAFADFLRENRARTYYPDTLYLKHYAQLAEIDEFHKLRANLKADC